MPAEGQKPCLGQKLPHPVLFYAHPTSELQLLSCPLLFSLCLCGVEEKCKDNV